MSKHTPGPWEAERGTVHLGSIATLYGDGEWWEVWSRNATGLREADANLVKAAPDLLRELQRLVDLLGPLEQSGGLNVPGLATLNGPRAALAKAREGVS